MYFVEVRHVTDVIQLIGIEQEDVVQIDLQVSFCERPLTQDAGQSVEELFLLIFVEISVVVRASKVEGLEEYSKILRNFRITTLNSPHSALINEAALHSSASLFSYF